MLTRHHLLLTLGYTLLLMVPFMLTYPAASCVLLCGAGIGSIIPDFHMKRPSRWQNPKNLAYGLTRATGRVFVPVLVAISRHALKLEPDPLDKRITHSGQAWLIYAFCASVLSGLIFLAPELKEFRFIAVFLGGTILGFLLHLLEDACTKKGICPLFPVDARLFLVGTIRPCETTDRRILAFILLSFLSAAGLFLAGLVGGLAAGNLVIIVVSVISLLLIVMFRCSSMKLERRDDHRFRCPQAVGLKCGGESEDTKPLKV